MTLNVNDNVYNFKKAEGNESICRKKGERGGVSDSITLDMQPLLAQLRHFYLHKHVCTLTHEAKQITFHQATDQREEIFQHSPSEHQQQQSASP